MEVNKNGKYEVLDADDNVVMFDHSIDAREALMALDEKGNHRYFSKEKPEKKSGKADKSGGDAPEPKVKAKGRRTTKKPSEEKTE